MKLSKKYFNMVEIVLALAVVSVAIVSLMGMLPVALRASKNSVAENSVTSVVDVIKLYIDTCYNDTTKTSFYNSTNPNDTSSFLGDFINGENENARPRKATSGNLYDFSDNDMRQYKDDIMKNIAFQITKEKDSPKGIFLIEFFSGLWDEKDTNKEKDGEFDVTDFAADVRVWYQKLDGNPAGAEGIIYVPLKTSSSDYENNFFKNTASHTDVALTNACTFYVEISWPSGVKYENQEHRLYKFDYFAK